MLVLKFWHLAEVFAVKGLGLRGVSELRFRGPGIELRSMARMGV